MFTVMAGLFARVSVARKKRHRVDTATAIPSAASAARSSASGMSGAAFYSAQMCAALPSVVAERVSPPCGLAASFP